MRIEDFWEDRKAYYISFVNVNNQLIDRMILLPSDYIDTDEIEKVIRTKFNNVKKVRHINEWGDALLLKSEDC